MKKEFNDTGLCLPDRHYIMDYSSKLAAIVDLINREKYFTINRPRQFGKTTILNALTNHLNQNNEYLALNMSLEGVDSHWQTSDAAFAQMIVRKLKEVLAYTNSTLYEFLVKKEAITQDLESLSTLITQLSQQTHLKLVLLIDEVDQSSNYASFIRFLGMLRRKYLQRHLPYSTTFHSVILAGVHDIKSLKHKIQKDEDSIKYNSPWNIATDFEVSLRFSPEEIAPMLIEYAHAEKVTIPIEAISQQIYYYTNGHPFLISKIGKIIAENLLPFTQQNRHWATKHIDQAVQLLLIQKSTNFDNLIKNLEKSTQFYDLVYRIILEGEEVSFNEYNPSIHQGFLYGIFKQEQALIKIANRIYEQFIYDYMASKVALNIQPTVHNLRSQFALANNELDVEKILLKFQQFLKEEHNAKDAKFLERQGRLVFLSFLKPIINGGGYDFKEVQISEEKRLDVVITYYQHKYIIELKRWYGKAAHQKGLEQLANYLEKQHQSKGYLLIFDARQTKTWQQQSIKVRDKTIFTVWV